MRTYYTIATLDKASGTWHPQFGDYDLETVQDELEEYKGKGERAKIVRSADDQVSINNVVAALNVPTKES